ncbi:MAG: response regulator, partial [Desulfobacterales bacterium]
GEEALSHLRNSANRRPCIILLDLNMPKMNGIEFLKVKKQDEMMRSIPTVVLTTSREEQDKVNSFNLGVAGYMIKPVEYRKFVVVAKTIDIYWTLSELPGEG